MSFLNLKPNDFKEILSLFYYTASSDLDLHIIEQELLDSMMFLYNRTNDTNVKYEFFDNFDHLRDVVEKFDKEMLYDLTDSLLFFSKVDNELSEEEKIILNHLLEVTKIDINKSKFDNTLAKLVVTNELFNKFNEDDIIDDNEVSKLEDFAKNLELIGFSTTISNLTINNIRNFISDDLLNKITNYTL